MLQIPVYRGCERPLSEPLDLAVEYHGTDGLGDVADQFPIGDNAVDEDEEDDGTAEGRPVHAAERLIEMARREPGEITLVLLGPLTNAALAMMLDPRFGKNLREIFILGGNVEGALAVYWHVIFHVPYTITKYHTPYHTPCHTSLHTSYRTPYLIAYHSRT